jgi:hypothetical protein
MNSEIVDQSKSELKEQCNETLDSHRLLNRI